MAQAQRSAVDADYCNRLPKVELHAHLTGSISPKTLHEIWQREKINDPFMDLDDPLVVMSTEIEHFNAKTFFPLFDNYVYKLVDSIAHIRLTTRAVLDSFHKDGVRYLELRTTPRSVRQTAISKDIYITTVLDSIDEFVRESRNEMPTYLILAIDRRQTLKDAIATVELAIRLRDEGRRVVGIDLCGNPAHVPIKHLSPAFARAKAANLGVVVHFAELPASASKDELELLLSWEPDRLGHVIHVPDDIRQKVLKGGLGVELCLSCNVLAGLTQGGYAAHHFGEWWREGGSVALCTDDVGVFGSPLSRECLLAATNFNLSRGQLIDVQRTACNILLAGENERQRMLKLLNEFERGES